MSIGSIVESGYGWPAPNADLPLAATARLLGLAPSQLSGALRAGASLSQLAAHQGVSRAAVHATVAHDLSVDASPDASAVSDAHLGLIASGVQAASVLPPAPTPSAGFDGYA